MFFEIEGKIVFFTESFSFQPHIYA